MQRKRRIVLTSLLALTIFVFGWLLSMTRSQRTFRAHGGMVHSIDIDPTGKLVASGGADALRVWQFDNVQSVYQRSKPNTHLPAKSVQFLSEKQLLCTDNSAGIVIVNTTDWSEETRLGKRSAHIVATGSTGGRWIAGYFDKHPVRIWDLEERQAESTLQSPKKPIGILVGLAFHPQKPLLAGIDTDGNFIIWDITSGKLINQVKNQMPAQIDFWRLPATACAFDPDGSRIFSGVAVYDFPGGKLIASFVPASVVRCVNPVVAVAPNGNWVAIGDEDGRISVWNARTLKLSTRFRALDDGDVLALRFSPDSRYLLTGGAAVDTWDNLSPSLTHL